MIVGRNVVFRTRGCVLVAWLAWLPGCGTSSDGDAALGASGGSWSQGGMPPAQAGADAGSGAPASAGSSSVAGTNSGGLGGAVASGGTPAGEPGTSGSAGRASAGGNGGNGGSNGGGSSGSTGTAGASGSAGAGGNGCDTPPAPSALVGWASQSGLGVATTTGGGDATPQVVTTMAELNTAAAGTMARAIHVKGSLAAGSVKVGSNKTIVGLCGAQLHGHVDMSGSVNVIFRNLKVVGYNCSDSPSECKSGADAITVVNSAHHIWFDHDDVSDGSDGNLDITNGSDFVTVSWTKFSYSTKRTDPVTGSTGHRFSNLIGAADGLAVDVGHLNVTWHHDWWADNVAERMPRSRNGNIHVVNNLFTAAGNDYCTNSGNLSHLLVENNVYVGVANPLQENDDGNMLSRGNVFTSTTGSKTSKGSGF